MLLEDITLAVFATSNGLRIFAYIPQICRAATDKNGASAISYTTWSLFLVAHLSTVAYAIVNRSDWGLAACFSLNAACCLAILAIVFHKRRRASRPPYRNSEASIVGQVDLLCGGRSSLGMAACFHWD